MNFMIWLIIGASIGWVANEDYRTRNLEMKGGNGQDVGDYNREIREAQ